MRDTFLCLDATWAAGAFRPNWRGFDVDPRPGLSICTREDVGVDRVDVTVVVYDPVACFPMLLPTPLPIHKAVCFEGETHSNYKLARTTNISAAFGIVHDSHEVERR